MLPVVGTVASDSNSYNQTSQFIFFFKPSDAAHVLLSFSLGNNLAIVAPAGDPIYPANGVHSFTG